MEAFDEEAESKGQTSDAPPPQGRRPNRESWKKSEGYFIRVALSGAAPAKEQAPEVIPQYVHDRNVVRRGETAVRRGRQLEPGLGSNGFGTEKL